MTFTAARCFFTAGILIAVSKARMVLLVVGDLVIVHLVATSTLRKFWMCIIAYLLNATFLHLVFITVLIHLISSLLLQLLLLLLVQSSVLFRPCSYFRFDMGVVWSWSVSEGMFFFYFCGLESYLFLLVNLWLILVIVVFQGTSHDLYCCCFWATWVLREGQCFFYLLVIQKAWISLSLFGKRFGRSSHYIFLIKFGSCFFDWYIGILTKWHSMIL